MRCPACGEENAEQAKFCSNCGAELATRAAIDEERKVVSVLFVDLVGFTARSDTADPEDVRAILRRYHELLKREIERYGGTVEKFIGDAVMAIFGAPVAHEDDAERAIRAALRIVEAIDELNEATDLDLAVRGAVNTGEAVVTLGARPEAGEGFVTGDVVNVASRLQGIASVGGVVMGELTYRVTRDQIESEELEPVQVKGKQEPVAVWRAIRPRGSFGVDVEPGSATPMIGREHELSLLEELFRRTLSERSPQFVTLSGEPGVGKSRIAREFRRFIDDLPELVYWRQGRCLPYGDGITFWALGEIVKSHAGIADNDDPERAADKLAVAVQVVDDEREREWLRARLAPLLGIGEEAAAADRDESFTAWRTFVEEIAATNPMVLVIEDLHWADPSMRAFVEHLEDWTSGVPLFVLCTARPELYEREPAWGGGKRNHTAVSLSPLSQEETARLLSALLDQAVLPAGMQTALLERAGGNPLYAEEFVRMLVDRGALVRHVGRWDLAAADDIAVPENVQALIAARLDTLGADRKALLQDAAVIGKVFWARAIAEMAELEPQHVREELQELVRKEFIRPARRSSIEGEAEYAFWHLLIRDVAYGQIPRASRAAKHRAAADWLQRMAGERVADAAELLAYHYEEALGLARAVGEDTSEVEALARHFLLMAAERASRLDVAKFQEYVLRALAMTRPGQPERLQVLLFASRGWRLTGGNEDDTLTMETIDEARLQGDELAEGQALALLSYTAWVRGDAARQAELLEESLAILTRYPPGPELAFAYTRAAAAAGLAGRIADSLPLIERAFPIVQEFGDDVGIAILLQFRGIARVDLGDVDGGFDDLREGLQRALDSAPAGIVASAHVNLGDATWLQDGPEAGLELYREAESIGERRGSAPNVRWARMQSMWPLFDLGRWDEVLEIGEQLLEEVTDPSLQIAVLIETFRQLVLADRGVFEAGADIEARLLPRAREIADGQVIVPVFRLAAIERHARGDVAGAVAAIREALAMMRERPGLRGWLLDDSARICLAAGDEERLAELLEGYTPYLTRNIASVASARAALAEVRGDIGTAFDLYTEATSRWEVFPHVFEHAHALLGAGRCSLALGRPGEAAGLLAAARELFSSLGAVPSVAASDEMIALATAKTS